MLFPESCWIDYFGTSVLPSLQNFFLKSGFRSGREANDISSAWQLQEKYIKQLTLLYQVFVYLTKAVDTFNSMHLK